MGRGPVFDRPSGTGNTFRMVHLPGNELPGYFGTSLRDRKSVRILRHIDCERLHCLAASSSLLTRRCKTSYERT